MGLRWRAAGGDRTGLRVEEYGWNYLSELAGADVSCDCVGARLVKIGHVLGSRSMVGFT